MHSDFPVNFKLKIKTIKRDKQRRLNKLSSKLAKRTDQCIFYNTPYQHKSLDKP